MSGSGATGPLVGRRVLFVTGTRADYGKLKPLMRAVRDDGRAEVSVFVTGMHLLEKYGSTWREVVKDGFDDPFLYFNQDRHTDALMDRALANTIVGLSHYVSEHPVDLIVVHGDRVEALAGAVVGSLNGVLVAHVEGGEVSGTVDELLRHTITKMAHLHFVSNQQAADRVTRMGEYPESVFVVGAPNIDVMRSDDLPSIDWVRDYYEIEADEFALLLVHPVVGESDGMAEVVDTVVRTLVAQGRPVVALYPNNDTGSAPILGVVEALGALDGVRVLPSMRFEAYLTALRHAAVLIGNSSSGIHEAPVYGVPSINMGDRQRNRFETPSICTVPFEVEATVEAAQRLWGQRFEVSDHFGRGDSADRFLEVLAAPSTWDTVVLKQFRDA